MKHLGPLLDVILGMLLVFVSIAAVSGAAKQTGEDSAASAPVLDPQVLHLRTERPSAPIELTLTSGTNDGGTPIEDPRQLDLTEIDEIELTVRDPALYELLTELERRGKSPIVQFEE